MAEVKDFATLLAEYPQSYWLPNGNLRLVGVPLDVQRLVLGYFSPDKKRVVGLNSFDDPYRLGGDGSPVTVNAGDTIMSFNNEVGKLIINTNKGTFTADLNAPNEDGQAYGDQFFKLSADNVATGRNQFSGVTLVATVNSGSNNSDQAASTSFVQKAIVNSLTYTVAFVYREGQLPSLWNAGALFDPFNGRATAHDLMVLHGKTTARFAMRFGNFRVAAHGFVVQDVYPGARFEDDTEDTISIDIAGITVLGSWSIYHSNTHSTKPLLVTVRDAPYIALIGVYQYINGTQPDVHTFTNCTVGRVGRSAAFNGQARQLLRLERCTIGVGVTSGALTDVWSPGELRTEYTNCIFRLNGTATMGPTNLFGGVTFINCEVVAADGTSTILDNRPTVQTFNFQDTDPVQEPGQVKQWVRPNGEVVIQGPTGAALVLTTVGV
jgi:hypothetical protein